MSRADSFDHTFLLWAGMRGCDMRPRQAFVAGQAVVCDERPLLGYGKMLRVDDDNRLGLVQWGSGKTGWGYLKDLKIIYELPSWFLRGAVKQRPVMAEVRA